MDHVGLNWKSVSFSFHSIHSLSWRTIDYPSKEKMFVEKNWSTQSRRLYLSDTTSPRPMRIDVRMRSDNEKSSKKTNAIDCVFCDWVHSTPCPLDRHHPKGCFSIPLFSPILYPRERVSLCLCLLSGFGLLVYSVYWFLTIFRSSKK